MNKIEILTCHCKEVQIELKLDNGIEEMVRCNCSLCKRRGYIMANIKLENLKIIKGKDKLSVYKFGKKQHAEHFFCKICGIYTHHNRRSDPNGAAVNIGCIDAIDPFEYKTDLIDMKNK